MSKFLRIFAILLLVGSVAACNKKTESSDNVDKQKIEDIVKNYILEHPEVIMQSVDGYQQKQAQAQEEKANADLGKYTDEIYNNPASPTYGNPKGSVTVVEFFDYNCGYCKRMVPDIARIVSENKDVKVIFKEIGILGPTSQTAAQAALAVNDIAPAKYFDFYVTLMGHEGPQDDASIKDAATKIGLNGDEILTKMKDKKYTDELNANMELARNLAVEGTPTFIIGKKIFRGAIGYEGLKTATSAAPAEPAAASSAPSAPAAAK